MENDMVGYRFHPTDEELINYYLKNKILGNTCLVDQAISEININNYEPMSLPLLSKIKSSDHVWYFFSPRRTKRFSTMSNYWKPTGKDREIKDRRGNKIGLKKTLVYYERGARKNVKNHHWVMHEYKIRCWSDHPDPESYVICKIKYKAENSDILYGNKAIITTQPEVQHQVVEENLNGLSENVLLNPLNQLEDLSLLPQTPYLAQDDEENVSPWQSEDLFFDQEFILQENCNKYRPRKPVSGIIVDYLSDSEAESIFATSYQETSSPEDSMGSSNAHSPSG